MMRSMLWGLGLVCLCWACGSDDDDDDQLDSGTSDAAVQQDATTQQDAAVQQDATTQQDAADGDVEPTLFELQLPGKDIYDDCNINAETWEFISYAVLLTTYNQEFGNWMAGEGGSNGSYWTTTTIAQAVKKHYASHYSSCEEFESDEDKAAVAAQVEAELLESIPAKYTEVMKKEGKRREGKLEQLSLLVISCKVKPPLE